MFYKSIMKQVIFFSRLSISFSIFFFTLVISGCSKKNTDTVPAVEPEIKEIVYDETGCLYTSYKNLVMAGYQGWFAAQGDASERGWYHYQNNSCGGFLPGCASIDFWPDMSEYSKRYKTPFQYANGTEAFIYSPYDEETIDLHFKWMNDYGIDGVFIDRKSVV